MQKLSRLSFVFGLLIHPCPAAEHASSSASPQRTRALSPALAEALTAALPKYNTNVS
jgi:hypothetical protein